MKNSVKILFVLVVFNNGFVSTMVANDYRGSFVNDNQRIETLSRQITVIKEYINKEEQKAKLKEKLKEFDFGISNVEKNIERERANQGRQLGSDSLKKLKSELLELQEKKQSVGDSFYEQSSIKDRLDKIREFEAQIAQIKENQEAEQVAKKTQEEEMRRAAQIAREKAAAQEAEKAEKKAQQEEVKKAQEQEMKKAQQEEDKRVAEIAREKAAAQKAEKVAQRQKAQEEKARKEAEQAEREQKKKDNEKKEYALRYEKINSLIKAFFENHAGLLNRGIRRSVYNMFDNKNGLQGYVYKEGPIFEFLKALFVDINSKEAVAIAQKAHGGISSIGPDYSYQDVQTVRYNNAINRIVTNEDNLWNQIRGNTPEFLNQESTEKRSWLSDPLSKNLNFLKLESNLKKRQNKEL